MDPAALTSLCILLAHGAAGSLPPGVHCRSIMTPTATASAVLPPARSGAAGPDLTGLAPLVTRADARDGIARVAYSEAGNQGDSGLAAVVYTILNRLADGRWGGSIDDVLNARHQFEPVMRAGGDWRNLPPVSEAHKARIDTIINLALEGRLPDLTNGARYFQNPRIVADRAGAGQVPASLVNFGGAQPSAVIGAHSFYAEPGRGGGRHPVVEVAASSGQGGSDVVLRSAGGAIFVGVNRRPMDTDTGKRAAAAEPTPTTADLLADTGSPGVAPPRGAMFVIAAHAGGDN